MADPADARRRAEEALRYDHDHANSPEVRRRLRGAVEALLAAEPATERETRLEAAYQREHARLTEVLGALSEVLPPGAEIRPALLALKARAEAAEPAKGAEDGRITHHAATGSVTGPIRGVVEDVADISARLAAAESRAARLAKALAPFADPERYNTAEEECRENKAMRWCAVHSFRWPCPVGPARAAIAAEEWNAAIRQAPPSDAVREAAERLREKMQETYDDPRYMNVWATAQERLGPYTGPNWIAEAEALDAALRATASPAPGSEVVREAAEVLAEWDKEEVRRASPSVRRLVRALSALAVKPSAQPAGDAVREAAESLETWTDPATGDQYAHGRCVGAPASAGIGEAAEIIRRIVTNHDARITERGVLVYGQPCMSTGFVEAIEWLSRYDAALRGGQKGGK